MGLASWFARQTRSAPTSRRRWTQNEQLYPYASSPWVTGTGANGNDPASLHPVAGREDQHDGRHVLFTSRPVAGLGLRAVPLLRPNQTVAIPRVGSFSASPDRLWSNTNLAVEPLGYITASPYSNLTDRFDGSASYDIGMLTLEGAYRHVAIDRTYREADTTVEDGYTLAAIFRANEFLHIRGSFDDASRTAEGHEITGSDRLPADLADRDAQRMGVNVELMPNAQVSFILGWVRTDADYKNRDEVAGVSGTAYGLLTDEYDSYTAEVDYMPNDRLELNAYYTREDNRRVTQAFSGGINLVSMLTFDGSDGPTPLAHSPTCSWCHQWTAADGPPPEAGWPGHHRHPWLVPWPVRVWRHPGHHRLQRHHADHHHRRGHLSPQQRVGRERRLLVRGVLLRRRLLGGQRSLSVGRRVLPQGQRPRLYGERGLWEADLRF
jgi:hypothetical protein